jgi:hypothetical protein
MWGLEKLLGIGMGEQLPAPGESYWVDNGASWVWWDGHQQRFTHEWDETRGTRSYRDHAAEAYLKEQRGERKAAGHHCCRDEGHGEREGSR